MDIIIGEKFRLLTWTSFTGQFINPDEDRGWEKGVDGVVIYPSTRLTLLEYLIIWCKIQVIINPFIPVCNGCQNFEFLNLQFAAKIDQSCVSLSKDNQ